jgi:adenosylcobinamide kinase/adenosylcobinamide-phosphate guanylyltransferase
VFVFVSGAVRSGKSAWAEEYALSLSRAERDAPLVYLATARVYDQEMRERVLRHQTARGNKGFETWERDVDVSKVLPRLNPGATLLLECLGTLLANEMFGRTGDKKAGFRGQSKADDRIKKLGKADVEKKVEKIVEKIYGEILSLKANAANLLVVSNDVFMDDAVYDDETENYRRALGALHVKLARDSNLAVECACGRVTIHKQPISP